MKEAHEIRARYNQAVSLLTGDSKQKDREAVRLLHNINLEYTEFSKQVNSLLKKGLYKEVENALTITQTPWGQIWRGMCNKLPEYQAVELLHKGDISHVKEKHFTIKPWGKKYPLLEAAINPYSIILRGVTVEVQQQGENKKKSQLYSYNLPKGHIQGYFYFVSGQSLDSKRELMQWAKFPGWFIESYLSS